jgi:hypothetical protein
MTTKYLASMIILVSLIVFISSTAFVSVVATSTENRMMVVFNHRMTANENIRMIGTGSSNVDNDDDDGDENDDGTDDNSTEDADAGGDDEGDDNEAVANDDYGSGHGGDDIIPYDKDCEAIRSGSEISATEYVHLLTYQIDLALEIDGDIGDTLARLEKFLQMNIATDLAGCNLDSTVATDVDLQYVLFDVSEDTESSKINDF